MISESELFSSNLLVVDDDPMNIEVLEEILDGAGYVNVTCILDPIEAVDIYQNQEFDLVLLDVLMPGIDGFEVINRLNKIDKEYDAPVLMLSALSDTATKIKALNSGARDFINKPFNPEEVLARIRNILEIVYSQKQLKHHNAILDQKVKERTEELEETRLEIIHRLGIAAEYRDNETGLHIIRMSKFAYEIGKNYGLDDHNSTLLLHASPMHDIGKIGIPDDILLKPGKLTPEEWEVMKTHTTIGAKILSGHQSELIQKALSICLTHHEKWDGTGYPKNLAKEEIPIEGRITAIADIFDALTSNRPYKNAWPVEKAVSVIVGDVDTHFDPDVVTAFEKTLPTMLKIKDQYVDVFEHDIEKR